MAWGKDDIVRSVRRYASLTLDEGWTLRTERREVADDERPVFVVSAGDFTPTRARSSPEQGEVESQLPLTLYGYPAVAENPREGQHAANLICDQLIRLIMFGVEVLDPDDEPFERRWSGPFRLPLWDYEGVPTSGAERAGPPEPHDVLWVPFESQAGRTIPDPDDAARFTVAVDLRVTVEGPGATTATGPPVAEFEGEYVP